MYSVKSKIEVPISPLGTSSRSHLVTKGDQGCRGVYCVRVPESWVPERVWKTLLSYDKVRDPGCLDFTQFTLTAHMQGILTPSLRQGGIQVWFELWSWFAECLEPKKRWCLAFGHKNVLWKQSHLVFNSTSATYWVTLGKWLNSTEHALDINIA